MQKAGQPLRGCCGVSGVKAGAGSELEPETLTRDLEGKDPDLKREATRRRLSPTTLPGGWKGVPHKKFKRSHQKMQRLRLNCSPGEDIPLQEMNIKTSSQPAKLSKCETKSSPVAEFLFFLLNVALGLVVTAMYH